MKSDGCVELPFRITCQLSQSHCSSALVEEFNPVADQTQSSQADAVALKEGILLRAGLTGLDWNLLSRQDRRAWGSWDSR